MNRKAFGKVVLGFLFGLTLTAGLLLAMDGASLVARADPGALFVKTNGTGTDCTRAAPCNLQTAIAQANAGDTIYVAGGTYHGSGDAVISVTQSITLYGGWNGSATGDLVRNAGTYRSFLDGEGQRRVVYVASDIAPIVDGFVIAGGNASNAVTAPGYGGGIYSNGADLIIANNIITNNVACTGTGWCYGGGIYVRSGDQTSLVRNNQVLSNAANSAERGMGGGLSAEYWDGTVQDNVFRDNLAGGSGNGQGGGIQLYRSPALVSGNTLRGNRATPTGGFGGGIYAELEGLTLTSNRVFSSTAQFGAICISSAPRFTMTNNVIAQNVGDGVVLRGNASYPTTGALLHNTVAQNGEHGVYVGCYNSGYSTITLTNNIIVSHTVGIFLYEPATGEPNRVTASHTLFFDTITNTVGSVITSTGETIGDPLFVNLADLNYHIQRRSPAVDAGIDARVFTDMDGDLRPMGGGPDIGADEWRWLRLFLPVVLGQ
jgi:hypothetical protein